MVSVLLTVGSGKSSDAIGVGVGHGSSMLALSRAISWSTGLFNVAVS